MKDVLGFAVFPAFQGKGIGRALLQEIEHWAKATNASAVRLVSGESRVDLIHSIFDVDMSALKNNITSKNKYDDFLLRTENES